MLRKIFPFIDWFRDYSIGAFKSDFVSGVTVALVLIPQSMAYAQLAGLPAYYGLYAAFLPPMVAALFGSSRQLATGPVAVVSLMTAATLEPLATAGGEAYIAYAILLALLVGLFQLSLGVLRLGVVVNFLSHPVVIGFTNAAAIIIATSQLSKLFGVSVDSAAHHYETIWRVVLAAWNFTHWPTFFLGVLAFGIMFSLKKLNPKIPYVLAAVAVTTLISWGIGFQKDRVVSLDQIDSREVRDHILEFNRDVHDIELVSEARSILNSQVGEIGEIEDVHNPLCLKCHTHHELNLQSLRGAGPAVNKNVLPKTILQLHAMAGLMDLQIDQVKERASELRKTLRALEFHLVESEGSARFVPAEDNEEEPKVWRMRVGNNQLDPDKITFMGGGAVVATIPGGLPKMSIPEWDGSVFGQLFIAAIIISILGFMEAISIAKAMAARTGQRLDPNQELIGQGLANIFGSVGQSYAVSGSFSRSAVNIQSGAVSGLSSVITSAVVVVVLMFFTPLLYHLPQSVLASVIMMAVIGLVNFKGVVHAYKVKQSDGIISIVSFVATLIFAPHLDRGILIGVALSIGIFLYGKMKPQVAELSLWSDGHFHSAQRRRLKQCKHLAVIRFDGPLFFANTSYLEDEVLDRVRKMPGLKAILFKSDGINEIDATGEDMLSLLIDRLRSGGYDVYFSGFNEDVVDTLRRSHLYEKIGKDHIFITLVDAVDKIWPFIHEKTDEDTCPLVQVVPLEAEIQKPLVRVLLVDDEKDFVAALAKRLDRRGMKADFCHNGTDTLNLLIENEYDAVVLDLRLEKEKGENVLRSILDMRPKQPVILLTGHGAIDSAVECMRYGAFDYMLKPCDIDELVKKIHAAQKASS
ncbi:MAG: response regulator [Acidobacteria bacterium]|nr:response regulator [Acidobacteriota bacterium]